MAVLCKNCGGTLLFSPSEQKMCCKMCGATFEPETVESYSKKLLEEKELYQCRIYSCDHCGGDIVVNGTEASTVCPFCGNPTVVFKRVSKERRPDGIIPFYITRDQAINLIRMHLKRGRFIPSAIKKADIRDVKGIYIPFWVIDCYFNDAVLIKGIVKSEDDSHTTSYFGKAARCYFSNVALDASSRLSDEMCKKLEPFDFNEAKEFNEEYLSGFYSDISDMSPEGLREALLRRCDELFCKEAIMDIPAIKKEVVRTNPSAQILDTEVYLMIPAWFYTFDYKGEHHTVIVNGQTGKTVGAVPMDKRKAVVLASAVAASVLAFVLVGFFSVEYFIRDLITVYIAPVLGVIGGLLIGVSVARIRHMLNNLRDTKSEGAFLYAKEREVV
ncbi:MAG: hypothetical protein IJ757_05440 [Clostridiales bacterium]|nr:hypothetical protein [Clostridiales bacterium]